MDINSQLEEERQVIFDMLSKLPPSSHSGSADIKLFVGSKDISSCLEEPNNALPTIRKKENLQKVGDSKESPPEYRLSDLENKNPEPNTNPRR